jgi:dUTP pyrophosphatase
VEIKIKLLPHAEGLPLPAYQSPGAAGLDLVAAVAADAPLSLPPGGRALVPTGLVVEIAPGFEAQARPRSGLALNHGVTVLNSPGTIDSDYRGEVGVILINHGDKPFEIIRGARIAQLVVAPAPQARLTVVDDVTTTARGEGGFGSSDRDAAGT